MPLFLSVLIHVFQKMLVVAFHLLNWSACLQVSIHMFVSLLHVKKPSSLLLVYGKEKCKFLLATCSMRGSSEDFIDDLFIQFSLGMVHIYAFTFRVRFGDFENIVTRIIDPVGERELCITIFIM